jgi:hypothetical protein
VAGRMTSLTIDKMDRHLRDSADQKVAWLDTHLYTASIADRRGAASAGRSRMVTGPDEGSTSARVQRH